jgi:hypothetical protein
MRDYKTFLAKKVTSLKDSLSLIFPPIILISFCPEKTENTIKPNFKIISTLWSPGTAPYSSSCHRICQHHKNQYIFQSNCCFHHQGRRGMCKKKCDTDIGNSRPGPPLMETTDCSETFIPIHRTVLHLTA